MTDSQTSDAADFLLGRINFERHPLLATRHAFKLERMRRLLAELGNPQDRIPAVHIAGTKGKGSTAVMVASALAAAGIRTGLYTSPHIESFTERLRINGRSPTPREFDDLLPNVSQAIGRLDAEADERVVTYFEALTAMAWEFFVRNSAEIVVLEVGLGGRLDATNICRPEAVAITNISRDHTNILGESLAEIAFEKAGIIKPGVPCVSGVRNPEAQAVIRQIAGEQAAPLIEVAERYQAIRPRASGEAWRLRMCDSQGEVSTASDDPLPVPLMGEHQADNAAIAHCLLDSLARRGWPITRERIVSGWQNLAWPARIEVLGANPTIILDAAHNWASAAALTNTLKTSFSAERRILLFAGSQEKDVSGILRQLAPLFDTVVLTAFQMNSRAMPISRLEQIWQAITGRPAHTMENPTDALAFCRTLAGPRDLICVTGSFFLAAEIRPLLVAS